MSKNCYLEYDEDGVLVCRVQHRNGKLCDLYEKTCEHGLPIGECEDIRKEG